MLLYTIYFVGTRRMKWSRLTANRYVQLSGFAFGANLGAITYSDMGAFWDKSICEHEKSFVRVLRAYEDDYKIVY